MHQNDDNRALDCSWRQTDKAVFISLKSGPGLDEDDVDFEITSRDLHLRLKDGREWLCEFFKEVDHPTCGFHVGEKEIGLQVEKAEPGQTWTQLQADPVAKRDTAPDPPVPACATSAAAAPSVAHKMSATAAPPPPPPPPRAPNPQQPVHTPVPPALSDVEMPRPPKAYVIDHANNDWFPKGDSHLALQIYIKQLHRESVDINFRDQEMTVRFKTNDQKFLQMHPDSSAQTLFSWTIHLKNSILPEQCTYKILPLKLEVILRKKAAERWGSLQRPMAKASAPVHSGGGNKWMPLSAAKNHDIEEMAKDVGSEKDVLRGAVGGAKAVDAGADNRSQPLSSKPTCTVPPQSHLPGTSQSAAKVELYYNPGFTGLDNLGNTCFMNSVLQVLANTRELRDYMLDSNMKSEINYTNPLGTGGTLIVTFAVLMRSLWSGKFRSCAPSKLKSTVASKASQFMGFAQHDAQEFMAFLLDGLHEDLNRVKNKPYIEAQDSDGKADEEVAEAAWQAHKKRNDSYIVDLFQGQYKSKLVCPECGKVSITFDPFMHLSVPLPKKKRVLPVFFFSKDYYRKPVKYVVALSTDATVEELKSVMAEKTGVQAINLRVFEMYRNRVQKIFNKASSLSSVSNNDIIFVCEVLSKEVSGEEVHEVVVMQRMTMPTPVSRCSYCRKDRESTNSLKHCTKCYRAGYCDSNCQKKHWPTHKMTCRRDLEPVGCPFVISLPASHCTYARLCQAMEAFARYSTNIFQPPVTAGCKSPQPSTPPGTLAPPDAIGTTPPPPLVRGQGDAAGLVHSGVGVDSGSEGRATLEESMRDGCGIESSAGQTEMTIEEATKHKPSEGVTTATIHGQPQLPERTMPPFFIKPVNMSGHGLVKHLGERIGDKGEVPIDLKQYDFLAMDWRNDSKQQNHVLVESKPLEYEEDDSVYEQYEEEKSTTIDHCLNLFTEPERLTPDEAWYCPQCKEHREATKQMSLWRLPSSLIIQLKRFSFKNMIWRDKIDKLVRYPVRGLDLSPYCHGLKGPVPPIYDLYGVINHHGGILGGHYTALSRLPSRESWKKNEYDWRLFDDSHVSPISEKNICTQSAYLLFYRLRQPYIPYVPLPPNADVPRPPNAEAPMECESSQSVPPQEDADLEGGDAPMTEAGPDVEASGQQQQQEGAESKWMGGADVPAERDAGVDTTPKYVKDEDELPYTNMEDID